MIHFSTEDSAIHACQAYTNGFKEGVDIAGEDGKPISVHLDFWNGPPDFKELGESEELVEGKEETPMSEKSSVVQREVEAPVEIPVVKKE